MPRAGRTLVVAFLFTLVAAPASARQTPPPEQQTLTDVLSFLLINRSIPTGSFVRDEIAAANTRDTIISLLRAELARLPINTPASGFTYRLDPDLGAVVRSSDHFGPCYSERFRTSPLISPASASTRTAAPRCCRRLPRRQPRALATSSCAASIRRCDSAVAASRS